MRDVFDCSVPDRPDVLSLEMGDDHREEGQRKLGVEEAVVDDRLTLFRLELAQHRMLVAGEELAGLARGPQAEHELVGGGVLSRGDLELDPVQGRPARHHHLPADDPHQIDGPVLGPEPSLTGEVVGEAGGQCVREIMS